jgi:hypothetical protein
MLQRVIDATAAEIGYDLIEWFQSQGLQPSDALSVMLHLMAFTIGEYAPSYNDMLKGVDAAQRDLRDLAIEHYTLAQSGRIQ